MCSGPGKMFDTANYVRDKCAEITSAAFDCQYFERTDYEEIALLELQAMEITDNNEHRVVAVRNMFTEFSR